MTDSTPVSIDDVRTLVAERHRFDEWLAALDSRRSDTPDHVYSRVHGDYVTRRDDVMTKLHAHVPGLEQLLGELDARATDLGLRSRAEEDERAEAMLRHAVGEYDDNKWDEVRNRVESTLATLGEEREALDAERDDVRGLLTSARPETPAVEEPATDASTAGERESGGTATLDSLSDADFTDADATAGALPDGPNAPHRTPDWLGTMTPASVPSLPDKSRVDSPRQQSEKSVDDAMRDSDDLDFTTDDSADQSSVDVFGDAQSGTRDSGTRDSGARDSGARDSGTRDARPASDGGDATPAPGAFDELAFLRSVIDPQASSPSAPSAPSGNPQAQKTLRCTECGTMNLPTEWYCERCGGELAAF